MLLEISVAYLCGSIPFGLILSNLFGKGNLRTSGSGNIGASNVVRTQGKLLGGLTFLFDVLKGIVPFFIFKDANPSVLFLFAVVGHMFPIWLKFQGGKGISTAFGALLAINPIIALTSIGIWLLIFLKFKISSLAGLIATFSGCVIYLWKNFSSSDSFDIVLFLMVPILIFIRHHGNIERLIKGEESRITVDKSV